MSQEWTFIHAADMQPGSPKSYRYKPAFQENWDTAKKQILELNPELLLIGGDLTRDGSIHKWELGEMKTELDSLNIPYHAVPGNMDTGNKHTRKPGPNPDRRDLELNITPEQLHQFEQVFGPSNWTFLHRNIRFTGFCDILLGSELPEEERLWQWLRRLPEKNTPSRHVVIMHYAMFIDDLHEENFDITQKDQYMQWYFGINKPEREQLLQIFKSAGVTDVITGHIHRMREITAEGITFTYAPGIAFGQWEDYWKDGDSSLGFLEYTVKADMFEKRFIPLTHVSRRTDGYGPGGHPPPETRDYSAAWEK
jgi:predicted phosphodiesterase